MVKRDISPPDYPYYNDRPASLAWLDWFIVLIALVIGFSMMTVVPHVVWLSETADNMLRSILFGAIPLGAFACRAGVHWTAIFKGWRWTYLWWGLLLGVVNLIFTCAIGIFALGRMNLVNNSVGEGLSNGIVPGGPALFYLRTGLQLFGEEVFTILPFLFLLWLGVKVLNLTRGGAILLAWIGSALIFGALHLSGYGWNVAQALLLIGLVRLVLTLAYMKTKSIWASTIAHVLNDWSMFTLLILVNALRT